MRVGIRIRAPPATPRAPVGARPLRTRAIRQKRDRRTTGPSNQSISKTPTGGCVHQQERTRARRRGPASHGDARSLERHPSVAAGERGGRVEKDPHEGVPHRGITCGWITCGTSFSASCAAAVTRSSRAAGDRVMVTRVELHATTFFPLLLGCLSASPPPSTLDRVLAGNWSVNGWPSNYAGGPAPAAQHDLFVLSSANTPGLCPGWQPFPCHGGYMADSPRWGAGNGQWLRLYPDGSVCLGNGTCQAPQLGHTRGINASTGMDTFIAGMRGDPANNWCKVPYCPQPPYVPPAPPRPPPGPPTPPPVVDGSCALNGSPCPVPAGWGNWNLTESSMIQVRQLAPLLLLCVVWLPIDQFIQSGWSDCTDR